MAIGIQWVGCSSGSFSVQMLTSHHFAAGHIPHDRQFSITQNTLEVIKCLYIYLFKTVKLASASIQLLCFRMALLQSESTLFDVGRFSILIFGRNWRWIDIEFFLLLSFGKSLFIWCVKLSPILSMFSCYSFIKGNPLLLFVFHFAEFWRRHPPRTLWKHDRLPSIVECLLLGSFNIRKFKTQMRMEQTTFMFICYGVAPYM